MDEWVSADIIGVIRVASLFFFFFFNMGLVKISRTGGVFLWNGNRTRDRSWEMKFTGRSMTLLSFLSWMYDFYIVYFYREKRSGRCETA
ncbi:hypothetical protein GGI43DRAFT_397670 [Trichoderma evansii]